MNKNKAIEELLYLVECTLNERVDGMEIKIEEFGQHHEPIKIINYQYDEEDKEDNIIDDFELIKEIAKTINKYYKKKIKNKLKQMLKIDIDEIVKNKAVQLDEHTSFCCEDIANLNDTRDERIEAYKELLKIEGINPDKDGIIVLQDDYIKCFKPNGSIRGTEINITVGE